MSKFENFSFWYTNYINQTQSNYVLLWAHGSTIISQGLPKLVVLLEKPRDITRSCRMEDLCLRNMSLLLWLRLNFGLVLQLSRGMSSTSSAPCRCEYLKERKSRLHLYEPHVPLVVLQHLVPVLRILGVEITEHF